MPLDFSKADYSVFDTDEEDPAKVEQHLNLDSIDLSTMDKRSPDTTKYLTDYNNAVIPRDDRGGPGNLNNWDKWISCSVGA